MSQGEMGMGDNRFWEMGQRLRRFLFSRPSKKRKLEQAKRQWFLMIGKRSEGESSPPDISSMQFLMPPPDRLWADPFLWSRDGQTHVYFEDYPYSKGIGRISVMALSEEGRLIGEPDAVLEFHHHLSYPYLFSFEGNLYMVPEQKSSRRVELYVCTSYPNKFERVATWFKGVRMVDVTVFEHEGRWWLFCAMKTKETRYDESLFAYYTDHPLKGSWVPHPLNPLVKDLERGRPGGRIFKDKEGRLMRPSQVCLPHYGAGLNLSVIEELTPETYRETLLWRLTGQEAGGWRGLHHMDAREGWVVMDAERDVPDEIPS
jgi:hypothetical protein